MKVTTKFDPLERNDFLFAEEKTTYVAIWHCDVPAKERQWTKFCGEAGPHLSLQGTLEYFISVSTYVFLQSTNIPPSTCEK